MSLSRWSLYLNRSAQVLRDNTSKVLRMSGTDDPIRTPLTLFRFNTAADIQQCALGCDADIGGSSTTNLELDEKQLCDGQPTAKFLGNMSLAVKKELEGRIRGGYAGFRNKNRPTLFGEIVEDVTFHRYLALRARVAGHPRTRNSYYVNIQTDGPITTDLWQHRLYFGRNDGSWEDLYIPFEDFVLTNAGEVAPNQISMLRHRIRTVGISILGGNTGVEGPYELNVDSIRAVNQEDVASTTPSV
ncbi:hypothetical protein JAAARDRAFT_127977 [Jaapia argillacea MUCL 33604]|uniref:NADH:ubiquinone oxidoreductase intermediate-associated protein 30 domain-containing protein n=1 Tax=Jaapia argillacea MUCL 33604 TaxID=933084 RepID=A0A067PWG6_9AGAM|nr:hypothetical protein JAAARDRAFT_127977 [Jaapia argillacea MUCL 33604]